MKQKPQKIEILGVPVDRLSMDEALDYIVNLVKQPGLAQIATVNPEFVMAAQTNHTFMRVLRSADLCLADGIGLVWASRRLGCPLPDRIPGSELVYHLAALCAGRGWRLFLLGAAPGVAVEAGRRLQKIYPGLIIAGAHSGSPAPADTEQQIALINASKADVLYVAYGAPAQDLWIKAQKPRLQTVRLALGVGGSLDFITGRAVRAPKWVQNMGLEWLHRLIKEPWRWRRMLALPRFAWAVIRT